VAESGENIRRGRRRQQSATANRAKEKGDADTRIPRQRIRHAERAVRVSYNPGQLVYREQLVRGRKLKPRWLGPYQVIQRVSDLVYKIRVGLREISVNIEQLRFCRATRRELRSQRREMRRQKRERYSQLDQRAESCERDSNRSSSGSADTAFWPSSGHSHQQPEAEYPNDVNRSALHCEAADGGTQLNAEKSNTEQQELSSGQHRYIYVRA
jgi:hypothetical protein